MRLTIYVSRIDSWFMKVAPMRIIKAQCEDAPLLNGMQKCFADFAVASSTRCPCIEVMNGRSVPVQFGKG